MAGRSIDRVKDAAARLSLTIDIRQMDSSTRTAQEAADACGCQVAQIVKSLVFENSASGELVLILMAGDRSVDLAQAGKVMDGSLVRADPKKVRQITGFAIGGVSPIGHLQPIPTYMDPSLLDHAIVWVAAGAPNAVFSIAPSALRNASGAELLPG